MNTLQKNWPALTLTFLGIVFLIYGGLRGEYLSVLRKAVMVCLECVGIG